MRAAVYVVRLERAFWKLMVSLDVGTDLRWCLEQRGWLVDGVGEGVFENKPQLERSERMILLSASMPLGWGVSLRDRFQSRLEMDRWDMRDWRRYIVDALKRELEQERKLRAGELLYEQRLLELQSGGLLWTSQQGITAMGESLLGQLGGGSKRGAEKVNLGIGEAVGEGAWGRQAYDWITASGVVMGAVVDRADDGRWEEAVEVGARRLAAALEGRSLLEAELQQLLAERLPELLPVWRSAVQHAHLQGRVLITAGVAAATARGGRGPLARPRARYRCRRCGSEVHSRTPCGSCGSSGCAYCEACLAMGRSRSCALLLRGSARAVPPAAGGTGGAPTESLLDRWGLSPAQRDAACAALRFLAQPQGAPAAPRDRHGPGGLHGGSRPAAWSIAHAARFPLALPRQRANSRAPALTGGHAGASRGGLAPPGRPAQSRFLLWAVTGAGKTEMIFPLIDYTLCTGGRVLVATPRRDVVLELAPRIGKAFPEQKLAVLYGGSSQRWEEARLILATTHQLMRFYHAFDLVIIDELDAFPYHNDPMLAFAAQESCKNTGRFIFLSATPPTQMQREVRQGTIEHAKVPARFHGHPLPVPRRIRIDLVESCLRRNFLPSALATALTESIQRGAQIFIFVSRIRHIEPLTKLLRRRFPSIRIEGTSSQDELRADKVLDFRATETRMLITTTILERGVTVPKSDVFILDADSDLFDEASLVQMAGRAGRSKDDPAGRVWFASPEWTRSQRGAVRQIRSMNTIARKRGFLH